MRTPKELSKSGQSIFRRLAKIVPVDDRNVHALSILADLLARYKEAQAALNNDGLVYVSSNGVPRANPAANFTLKLVPQIRALFSELGFYEANDSNSDDPLDDYMEG